MKLVFLLEILIAHILYYTGVYWLRRRFLEKRGAAVVLVYHRVLPGKRGTGEMVGEDALQWQMRYLKDSAVPVRWESILAPLPRAPRIRVLVTFDDGYRDIFTRALPVLERYSIPAVFFVTTNLVFGRRGIGRGGEGVEGDVFPSLEDLEKAKSSPLVTYGNHTATHTIVSRSEPGALEEELREAQRQFQDRLGITPEIFAYPRGRKRDISRQAASVLERLHMRAAFTMIPGLVEPKTDRYAIPRIGVSHVNSSVLFKVKMLGLLNPLVSLRNALAP
jgi:peptidoglycan/xylan/chitin deacetylase (PgdA/CDA1 family)